MLSVLFHLSFFLHFRKAQFSHSCHIAYERRAHCARIPNFLQTQKEKNRNFAHSVLFDYLYPYSAVFHDFYFQRDFLLCYYFAQKPNFFGWVVTKTGFSTFSKRGNRKSPLYLKATIHFDSSRTTRKVGSFSFTDFSKWVSLVSSILLFLLL